MDVLAAANGLGAPITHIFLTHGHVDHVAYVEALKAATGANVYLYAVEKTLYADDNQNGYKQFGLRRGDTYPLPDVLLRHNNTVPIGALTVKVLHTPGHTAGGMCLLVEDHLFTGDTLFRRSIGRYDLPTGNEKTLKESIQNILYTLPDATIVHPGHGEDTTIGEEKKENPYVTTQ